MQTMVLDETLARRTRADHHAHRTGEQGVASAEASELVARAGTGDQVAWDQLVDRYGGLVWAVARAHGLGPDDASDVSQVTWLLLTQHLSSLRQPERLEDWLLRIAAREADRMHRLRGREVPAASEHDLECPAATMCGAEVAVPGDLAASVASPSWDCAAPATNAKLSALRPLCGWQATRQIAADRRTYWSDDRSTRRGLTPRDLFRDGKVLLPSG